MGRALQRVAGVEHNSRARATARRPAPLRLAEVELPSAETCPVVDPMRPRHSTAHAVTLPALPHPTSETTMIPRKSTKRSSWFVADQTRAGNSAVRLARDEHRVQSLMAWRSPSSGARTRWAVTARASAEGAPWPISSVRSRTPVPSDRTIGTGGAATSRDALRAMTMSRLQATNIITTRRNHHLRLHLSR